MHSNLRKKACILSSILLIHLTDEDDRGGRGGFGGRGRGRGDGPPRGGGGGFRGGRGDDGKQNLFNIFIYPVI